MLVFDFTRELAALDPRAFVDLLARWGVAGVVTGEDFTFGRDRAGSIATLAELGAPLGLQVQAVAPITGQDGEIISSTRIRQALKSGDCETADRKSTRLNSRH